MLDSSVVNTTVGHGLFRRPHLAPLNACGWGEQLEKREASREKRAQKSG